MFLDLESFEKEGYLGRDCMRAEMTCHHAMGLSKRQNDTFSGQRRTLMAQDGFQPLDRPELGTLVRRKMIDWIELYER